MTPYVSMIAEVTWSAVCGDVIRFTSPLCGGSNSGGGVGVVCGDNALVKRVKSRGRRNAAVAGN